MLQPKSFPEKGNHRVCKFCAPRLEPLQSYWKLVQANKRCDLFLNFKYSLTWGDVIKDDVKKCALENPRQQTYRRSNLFHFVCSIICYGKTKDDASANFFRNGNLPIGICRLNEGAVSMSCKRYKDVLLDIEIVLDRRKKVVGYLKLPLSWLQQRHLRELRLFTSNQELIVKNKAFLPCLINISVRPTLPGISLKMPEYKKHVFMVTRGTRGDVEPFIALARGLANEYNYQVTILTEHRFQSLIQQFSEVERGKVSFRPIGGDTRSTIDSRLGKWAIRLNSDIMNHVMLSRVSDFKYF